MSDAKQEFPETPSGEPIDTDAYAEGEEGGPYDADGVFEPEHDDIDDGDDRR